VFEATLEQLKSRGDIARAGFGLRKAAVVWVFHDVRNVAWFERCIDEIASVKEVLPLVEVARQPRRQACAITFDDGLRSVLDVATPVLRERGLPHTVFVCTDVLDGGPLPWFLRVAYLIERVGLDRVKDRWKLMDPTFRDKQDVIAGLKQIPFRSILEGLEELEDHYAVSPPAPCDLFLSAEDVRNLASSGTTIGSHTHRHPILSLLSAQDQEFEVEESARVIESLTGSRPTEFAYPNGTPLDFNATTIAILRASGMRLAVTTEQRHLSPHDDLLALPRIGLTDGDSFIRRLLKSVAPSLSRSVVRERRLRSRAVL
jgi:peptidoglycan/xylan/chitin deacetylase (PgdA/CDA1 family)